MLSGHLLLLVRIVGLLVGKTDGMKSKYINFCSSHTGKFIMLEKNTVLAWSSLVICADIHFRRPYHSNCNSFLLPLLLRQEEDHESEVWRILAPNSMNRYYDETNAAYDDESSSSLFFISSCCFLATVMIWCKRRQRNKKGKTVWQKSQQWKGRDSLLIKVKSLSN